METTFVNVTNFSPSEIGGLVSQACLGYGCTVTFTSKVTDDGTILIAEISGANASQFKA